MKKTFIKMQSLSRKAWLCGGLIAMAAALVGCSSDAPDPGDPNSGVVQTDGDPLTVISDQATLSGMVLNYEGEPTAPTAYKGLPGVPDYSSTVNITTEEEKAALSKDSNLGRYAGKGIVIPANATYEGDLSLNGCENGINIIIAGTFKGNLEGHGVANVYIIKDGAWNNSNFNYASGPTVNIVDYDNGITTSDDNITFNNACTYQGKNFVHSKNVTASGAKIYVEGEVNVKTLTLNSSADLRAKCVIVEGKFYFTNSSSCYVDAFMKVNELEPNSGYVYLNENAYASINKLIIKTPAGFSSPWGKSTIKVNEYERSGDGQSWQNMPNWQDSHETFNDNGRFYGKMDIYVGVIKFTSNGSDKEAKADWLNPGTQDVKFLSDSYFNTFQEPMSECPSGEGNKPNPDPVKPNPGPDPFPNNPDVIIEITGKDVHSHPISATCIDVAGDMAYVSWHERGGNIHGCIEAIKIDGETATITSWMETPAWKYESGKDGANAATAYDFNHIIYDPDANANAVIVVGEHAKKGGIIGRIKLGDTFGKDAELNVLENRQLGIEEYEGNINTGLVAGRSGNCVVISPDRTKLLVASRGGYQKIPYGAPGSVNDPFAVGEDFKHLITSKMMEAISTAGSGKHLALFGNSLVSIEYTGSSKEADWWEDNTTALPAKITFWDNWENFPYNHTFTIDVDAFSPVFGKDVIAMDDQYIYSCQGHRGVAIYEKSSRSEKARFNVDRYIREHRNYFTRDEIIRMTGAAANGLAVDDKYIYIAYGGAGLWVLNKATFDVEGYYSAANSYNYEGNTEPKKASANYVKVMNDGKILVAYGRDGVKVFKMPLGK